MKTRLRIKQTLSLRERIELWAEEFATRRHLPARRQKEMLLKRVRTAEVCVAP